MVLEIDCIWHPKFAFKDFVVQRPYFVLLTSQTYPSQMCYIRVVYPLGYQELTLSSTVES